MRFSSLSLLVLFFVFLAIDVNASDTKDSNLLNREAVLEKSFIASSRSFGIPSLLVRAIARQESNCRPLVVNVSGRDYHPKNVDDAVRLCQIAEKANLQYDVGLMQINRYWIRKYRIPHRRLFNPQDNIFMGCFILASEIRRHGLTWKAVGKYHSPTAWRATRYAQKIKKHLAEILDQ